MSDYVLWLPTAYNRPSEPFSVLRQDLSRPMIQVRRNWVGLLWPEERDKRSKVPFQRHHSKALVDLCNDYQSIAEMKARRKRGSEKSVMKYNQAAKLAPSIKAFDRLRLDQAADRLSGDPHHRSDQQQRRHEPAERISLTQAVRPVFRRRTTGDVDGDQRGDQAERIDRLMSGVGEHHDRADRQTDDNLHHGEERVCSGRDAQPRTVVAVLMIVEILTH